MAENSNSTTLSESLRYVAHSAFLSAKGYAIKRLRAGKAFYSVLAELEHSQWLSSNDLHAMQNVHLRGIIYHAYQNVPYYRQLFDHHGIKPSDIDDVADLSKIPTLSKDAIRANPEDFIARNIPRRLLAKGWTTGTTGAPLCIYRTLASVIYDKATLARQRRWAGIDLYDRNVAVWGTAWGNVIVPHGVNSPPYWRFNAADNQLLFSYYHLSDANMSAYMDKLRDFKPAYIEAFPSTMLAFARYLRKQGETVPVAAIFTSSEPLYSSQRREIAEAFDGKIFNYYGHAERAITAAECEHGNMHVNQEYGVMEILLSGAPVSTGEMGEIVATGLSNYAMPLIRYQTGDSARFQPTGCPCGRQSQLLSAIDGRTADFILMPDGRMMPGDGVMEAFYGVDNIKESQLVQESINRIVVKIVKDDAGVQIDTELLQSNLHSCLGGEMNFTFEYPDSLWKKGQLKKRWVLSKLETGFK